jgi:arylsulfatase A-like enzyme
MKKLSSLLYLISGLLLFGSCEGDKFIDKPNILFIFTDDQRYNTVGYSGNEQVKTPNLDELSRSGITFTHTYNMGGWHGAVCVASRAMLNTGLFLWHAREAEKDYSPLIANRQFWSQQMEDLGYETYFSGKWHVKLKPEIVFNFVEHERPGMPNQTPIGYNRPLDISDSVWLPWDTANGGFWKGGKHWSEVLVDDAERFIKKAKDTQKPFFMYLAFNAPHDPRQSPKEYVDMYPVDQQVLPVSFLPDYPYKDSIGCGPELRDEALAPFPRTEYAVKVNQLEYYALISHTDTQIGRIIDFLKQTGQAENTYILLTADHGLSVGHHGLIGKQNLYDHSVRVPMIISGPGIESNKKRDQQVYLQDVMPTVLELAGGEVPQTVEFNSLLPMIRRPKTASQYDAIYGCYINLQRMVRTDDYKLIVYPKVPKVLLFDLTEDPDEMNNLADDSRYLSILNDMKELLILKQKEMDDPLDISELLKID